MKSSEQSKPSHSNSGLSRAKQKYLYDLLSKCRGSQRFFLSNKIRQLSRLKNADQSFDSRLKKLEADINASIEKRESRLRHLPKPDYPEELPVAERREEIIKTISENQVTIICGETGSGKTTQLPKMCLELGRGVDGIIGHTQPRRIAARSVAARIAEELKTELGSVVGYKVRFHDQLKDDSYVKLMTDGILLAEIRNDRYLNQYDTLIIDEAHERSLNIDFLLGYLRWLLPRRKDLKIIITSATIDPERFAKHFNFTGKKDGNAPIINVSGRTFPVEIRYNPLIPDTKGIDAKNTEGNQEEAKEKDMLQAIVDATDELMLEKPGGILIFLSGEREIRQATEALTKHHKASVEILPLFARLSAAEQNKIFHPTGARRIVLATNVAETSLTVPGIKYVIDAGMARISRYSWRSRVQRLPIEKVSQASANQRSGRCGRTSSGIAIRLYSEEDYESRAEFTLPEIQRTNLASVILQLTSLNLGDVYDFPYLEAPDTGMIRDGYKLLFELGAVNKPKGDNIKITPVGRQLARLPTDPRLGRMLVAAQELGVLQEVLVIVSALSIQDARERPLDKQQASDQKHSRFKDESSDFISLLKLWDYYHDKNGELSQGQLRKLCRKEFLSFMRLREWNETYRQLKMSLKETDLNIPKPDRAKKAKLQQLSKKTGKNNQQKKKNDSVDEDDKYSASYNVIHQSLLTGLLSNIGFKEENNEFQGVNNRKFFVFPGSALYKKPPKWIMSAEIVDTSRLFARTVAKIQPEWVEYSAKHLLKHHYTEPRWEKKAAQVVADQKSSLYGLTITPKKRVSYGPIDAVVSRQLFIRHALVYGEYASNAEFFQHNRQLIEEVENLEAKSRRRDILVDEEILFDFYDQIIPENIYNGPAFEKWRKSYEKGNADALKLTRDYLMKRDDSHVQGELYPDHLDVADMILPLSYHFEPGASDDGVTVKIPAAALNQLSSSDFDYLVPGMLEEKITEFIRSLPKQVRKQFVPAPEYAKACLDSLNAIANLEKTKQQTQAGKNQEKQSIVKAISTALHRITGHRISEDLLEDYEFSDHMLMRFEVMDESGKVIGSGRNIEKLKKTVSYKGSGKVAHKSKGASSKLERKGIETWDFDTLPESVVMDVSGMKIKAWPALVDKGDSVEIKLFDSPQKAQQQSGLLRLILLEYKDKQRELSKQIPDIQKMCLYYASTGKCDELTQSIIENTFRLTFVTDELLDKKHGSELSQQQFSEQLKKQEPTLKQNLEELCQQLLTVLSLNHDIRKQLKGKIDLSLLETLNDVTDQLNALVYPGFIDSLTIEEIRQYPRYLKAIVKRLDKLAGDAHKDRGLRLQIQSLWDDYKALLKKHGSSQDLVEFRWMLEEFRVSLFAQDLGTAYPVSEKRLRKRFNEIKSQYS
ncbi:ATP-dependent RNA helicase HrpA [Cocleimonas sp. KMM 6892]|uniref:ATP-dependent RNA helicase HrpA n=1 Tax=unclassified Cocleimonas TaxID=2639732 RepID=UPI002DBF2F57|nr:MULTISPECIES: ATP-dependent RNA helicase HrpA [unclassified Cocleimonas]MEB8431139.1 ATP-dependent RNA helicase HrpA [Cocleimonas sp. KMM 6892]MEC4714089.1 ATP-dependent RNA helicase HrpA [Cocleimonas sp. KMM 6895]MEC4743420.1 ATP-dependent RNA helicase HrpA [Cocleimonas sp. KMM 6896]